MASIEWGQAHVDAARHHALGRFPLGAPIRLGGFDIDNQPVAVLGKRVRHVAQLRLGEFTLLEQAGLGVGAALVRLVAALLALEIDFRVASRRSIRTAAVLAHETLVARPGLDHRAVDTEMLVRDEALPFGQLKHAREELARHVGAQQPIPVDAEHRSIPHGVVHAETDEPADQQVVLELLHQQALTAHREERLQQQCPQQVLGRNRRPAGVRVALVEQPTHVGQDRINEHPQPTQRMLARDPFLEADVTEHRRLGVGLATHARNRRKVGGGFQTIVCIRTHARHRSRTFSPAC